MDQTPSLRRALLGLALVIAAIVGGYLVLNTASDDASKSGASPDGDGSESQETVRFLRSGGWTGAHTTLVVAGDGTGTLRGSEIEKENIAIDIGEARGSELFRQLDDAWPQKTISFPSNCMDCYQYDVAYKGVLLTFHDGAPGLFKKPIQQLSRIMDRNIKL